jgi:lipopolysaccharide export system protein LptA
MNQSKNKISLLLCLLLCGHATLSYAERADREKPIQMEADRVTVDDPNQTSTFDGNVQMHQGTLLIEANKIVVTQDQKGNSQMTATGEPAHFRQKRDGVNEYSDGYGERIEYDTSAEIANIYGQARVKRDGDDVRGEHIIYNTKTGIFQVFGASEKNPDTLNKGRVTIVIQPKEQKTETTPNPAKPSATQTAPQP